MTSTLQPADRWEHGSHFHVLREEGTPDLSFAASATWWGTGRDALVGLLVDLGRPRVVCPDYFCPSVVEAMRAADIAVTFYADDPCGELVAPSLSRGDAWLRCNTLGLRAEEPGPAPDGVFVVDDHTHDLASPWARTGNAHYAFASLRKTLPLPDGGALWSPRGLSVPAPARVEPPHAELAEARLEAMQRKARYLEGDALSKEQFYPELVRTEQGLGTNPPGAMSAAARAALAKCPTRAWRERRLRNFALLRAMVADQKVLEPRPGAAPVALTLVFTSFEVRERVRARLVENRVYPALLWALDERVHGTRAAELSRRVLSVHVDQRYDDVDMRRAGRVLREAIDACR